jgi:hypothetical protein
VYILNGAPNLYNAPQAANNKLACFSFLFLDLPTRRIYSSIMARGLSDLQKWMLARALENAESDLCKPIVLPAIPGGGGVRGCPTETRNPVHLERSEIRADYYKFTPVYRVYRRTYTVFQTEKQLHSAPRWVGDGWEAADGKSREWLRQAAHFVKSTYPNYAAVTLAIARAHDRLRKRGLATDQVGIFLTDKGREVARLLATPIRTATPEMPIELLAAPAHTALPGLPLAEMEEAQ